MAGQMEEKCKNCETALQPSDRFCPHCGQRPGPVRYSLRHLILDTFSSLFNVDNRFFQTFLNIFIPGRLTLRYFEGKQVRFSHPVRFYLFTTFILFGILGYQFDKTFRQSEIYERMDPKKGVREKEALIQYDSLMQLILSGADNPDYRHGAEALLLLSLKKEAADRRIEADTVISDISRITFGPESEELKLDLGEDSLFTLYLQDHPDYEEALSARRKYLTERLKPDSVSLGLGTFIKNDLFTKTKISTYDLVHLSNEEIFQRYKVDGFRNRLILGQIIKIAREPGNAVIYLLTGFSWVAILFIPLIALWLKLIYLRRRRYYMEHLLFALHVTNFLFILMILFLLIEYLTGWSEAALILLLFPVYLLFAVRQFYRQNWFRTLIKTTLSASISLLLIGGAFILSIAIRLLLI